MITRVDIALNNEERNDLTKAEAILNDFDSIVNDEDIHNALRTIQALLAELEMHDVISRLL